MKKHLLKKILLSMVELLLFSTVTAQSFIRAPQYLKDSRSIVREVDKNIWLVNNYYWGNHVGSFSLIGLSIPDTKNYVLEDLVVHDFEIVEGKNVYYCGERHYDRYYSIYNDTAAYDPTDSLYYVSFDTLVDSTVYVHRKRAVIGYFSMDLDNQTLGGFYEIEKFEPLRIRSLDKIEVLPVTDGIHLIMTGSTYAGNGCLVDMSAAGNFAPSLWQCNVDTTTNSETFDDVAITKNFIVATQRIVNNWGRINYYPSPGSHSYTTINAPCSVLQLEHVFGDTILVEHCEQDVFVIASSLQCENRFLVSGFDFTNMIGNVLLPVESFPSPEKQLVDIKYDPSLLLLNFLQQYLYNGNLASRVWHLDNSLLPSGGLVSSNIYTRYTLFSLDRQLFNPGWVIASGHPSIFPFYVGSQLYLFQHWPGIGERCSVVDKIPCISFQLKKEASERLPEIISTEIYPEDKNFNYELWPVDNECDEIE